jgi:hypothetical protein
MKTASGRVVVHALRGDHGQNLGQALADKKAIAAGRDALTADKAEMQAQAAALREEIDAKSAQIANLEIQRAATTAEMETLGTKLEVLTDRAGRNSKAREQRELKMASQQHAQTTIPDTTCNTLEQTTAALSERAAGAAPCDAPHLPFNPDFVESMSTIKLSGDRGRKSAQPRLRPRRTVCVDLASEIEQSAHHTSLAKRLGYSTDLEPAA